jgi:adenosine 3'-phospho 5'-phosphosulfate transporter B2
MALVIASVLSLTTHRSGEQEDGRSGLRDYAAVAFSNLVATVCQYEVLKYLTFSVSTLAKTMKVVPVMAWGQFLGEKKYAPRQYLEALLVTFGCFLFVANRGWRSAVQKTYGDQVDDHDMEWAANAGFAILGVYFIFDGFTSSFQQKMFRRDKSTVVSQILYTSFFTTIFAFLWLLFTGQLRASLEFVTVHAAVRGDILILSASSTVAQFAIAYTIYSYSAVILASIMTFRQFLSVLISCYAFGAPLNVLQWLALLLIVAPAMFKHVSLPTDVDDKSPGRADRPRTDRPTEYDRL